MISTRQQTLEEINSKETGQEKPITKKENLPETDGTDTIQEIHPTLRIMAKTHCNIKQGQKRSPIVNRNRQLVEVSNKKKVGNIMHGVIQG